MSEATIKVLPWKEDEELATGSGQGTLAALLTPAENPDQVVQKKGLRVFEEMERKDAHYASALQTRKLALLSRGFEIQPAGDAPGDAQVAAFVRWTLDHMQGSFFQDLYEILDALGKGFSLSEIVYARAERGPWQGKVVIRCLKAKEQELFGFALDEYDNILDDGIVQNPLLTHGMRLSVPADERAQRRLQSHQGGGFNLRLPRDKFIHFAFNARAENPYGRGLGGLCYWYSWFKSEAGFKFWLVFLERYASPKGQVQIGEGASEEDIRKVKSILRSLQQETGVVVPRGMELSLLEASGSGSAGYERLVERCNAEISKAVLGQTLTTEPGRRGARSLGEVHQDILASLLRFDAERLQVALNEQLIQRLVDFNFLVDVYPRLIIPFPDPDAGALDARARGLRDLVEIGARIPERYVHEKMELPVARGDEPVLGSAPGASPAATFAERPLTRTQIEPPALKARKIQAQDELIEGGVARGRLLAGQLLEALIGQVRRQQAIEKKQYNVELSAPIGPLRETLVNMAVLANLTGRRLAVEELAAKGVRFAPERLAAFAEDEPPEIVGPAEALRLFRARVPISKAQFTRLVAEARRKHFTVAGIEEANLLRIVQEALIEAIENGGTVDTFAAAVRERGVTYTGRAFGQDLAGAPLKDSHMRLIFRNNVLSAYNQGREAIFTDPEVVDFIPFMMYSAIDDDRTRPAHRAMDGRIYRADDPIWIRWTPPNGHHCRCEKIPVSRVEARRLQETQIVTGPAVVAGRAVQPDEGFGGGAQ